MTLLLLLLIPLFIFVTVAILRLVLTWTAANSKAWWALPAWIAIALSTIIAALFLCLALGALAFGGIGAA